MSDPTAGLTALAVLILALIVDFTWGELPTKIHPVVMMGRVIRVGKRWGLSNWLVQRPILQTVFGLLMALMIPIFFALSAWMILDFLSPWKLLHATFAVILLKATFALSALESAALRVREALFSGEQLGDLSEARFCLRSLCSRDATELTSEQLTSATVASVAENLSDSVIAPLLFYLLAGVPGAVFYRTVNTMDAIIGYRGPLEYLGKGAARLDDLCNLIPARISTICLFCAGALTGKHLRRGLRVWWQDHGKTPSPNGGWPMAAMAGLLGTPMIKVGVYHLGAHFLPLVPKRIEEACNLARWAALIFATMASLWIGTRGLIFCL